MKEKKKFQAPSTPVLYVNIDYNSFNINLHSTGRKL